MDFNKLLGKSKDASLLSEKEYKCVSLQAITSEAIKENNKKRLKTLVEEINGHLVELRGVKNGQNHERCQKLIQQFEEILFKIATPSASFLTPVNNQLQELQTLVNIALKNDNQDALTKLAERIERNVGILMEIPEVKSAKSGDKDQEGVLEVVNKYTSLLNMVLTHVNGSGFVEADQETKKVIINEVEEKLKQMRQKRLNRLSNFVDQQSKLSLDRFRNKSTENLTHIPESDPAEPGLKRGGTLTRSFAERQIDKARNQQLSRPIQRNPTQIQKILNSFNTCVQGVAEDVPHGFTSQLEKELKSVTLRTWKNEEVKKEDKEDKPIKIQLKSTGLERWGGQSETSTFRCSTGSITAVENPIYGQTTFLLLEPQISKLEEEICGFRGLKRDFTYSSLTVQLSQCLVRVNEIPATSSVDQVEKRSLLERIMNLEGELQQRVERNEGMMRTVFEEVVAMIGDKYRMAC